jgi:hypothetical protein
MDKFIQRENLALFRRRLADPGLTDAQRQAILRLLAEEHAKGTSTEINSSVCSIEIGHDRSASRLAINDQGLIRINAANESHKCNAMDES